MAGRAAKSPLAVVAWNFCGLLETCQELIVVLRRLTFRRYRHSKYNVATPLLHVSFLSSITCTLLPCGFLLKVGR